MSWTVFPRIYTNLKSIPTARNFSNSTPIYIILWEMRNHYRNIGLMKNSKCQHFLFLKKQPQNGPNFSTFYLTFKESLFQYHKVRDPNFLSYATSWNWFLKFELKKDSFFWQKCREKHYKWDIEKNGITYSTAQNSVPVKFPLEWSTKIYFRIISKIEVLIFPAFD